MECEKNIRKQQKPSPTFPLFGGVMADVRCLQNTSQSEELAAKAAQTTGCSWRELVRVLFSVCLCPKYIHLSATSLSAGINALGAGAVSKIQAQHISHFRVGLPGATTTERRVNICCNSSAPWDLSLSYTDAKASKKKQPGSLTGCLADRLADLISCPCGKPLSWHFQKALKRGDALEAALASGMGQAGEARAGFGSAGECELWGTKLGAALCFQWGGSGTCWRVTPCCGHRTGQENHSWKSLLKITPENHSSPCSVTYQFKKTKLSQEPGRLGTLG